MTLTGPPPPPTLPLDLRVNAVEALGQIGPASRAYFAQLLELCETGRYPLDEAAKGAVGKLGLALLPRAMAYIDKASMRGIWGKALASFGHRAIPRLIKLWRGGSESADEIKSALSLMGPKAVPSLIRLLSSPKAADRVGAAGILSEMVYTRNGSRWSRDEERHLPLAALGPLVRAMKDKQASVRTAAANAAGRVARGQPGRVVPALVKALDDPDLGVRRAAVDALGALGAASAPAAPRLITMLGDTQLQKSVVDALGSIGPAAVAAAPALAALVTGNSQLRFPAGRSLAQLGPGALPSTLPLLKYADEQARRVGYGVMGRLEVASPSEAVIEQLLPGLRTPIVFHAHAARNSLVARGRPPCPTCCACSPGTRTRTSGATPSRRWR